MSRTAEMRVKALLCEANNNAQCSACYGAGFVDRLCQSCGCAYLPDKLDPCTPDGNNNNNKKMPQVNLCTLRQHVSFVYIPVSMLNIRVRRLGGFFLVCFFVLLWSYQPCSVLCASSLVGAKEFHNHAAKLEGCEPIQHMIALARMLLLYGVKKKKKNVALVCISCASIVGALCRCYE